jgi:hypothetical protein
VHALFDPARGSCERWRRWYDAEIECFNDRTCGTDETCSDDQCHCGSTPFPFATRVSDPRCQGDDIVADHATCAAAQIIVTSTSVLEHCEPTTGARCVVAPGDSPECVGTPPPHRCAERRVTTAHGPIAGTSRAWLEIAACSSSASRPRGSPTTPICSVTRRRRS